MGKKARKPQQPEISKTRMYVILLSKAFTIIGAIFAVSSLIGMALGITTLTHVMLSVIICLAAGLVYRSTGFYYVDKKRTRRK